MNDPGTLWELAMLSFRVGLLSFGGGSATLGEMQREIVAHGWLTYQQFMEAYALGRAIPGGDSMYVVPIGYRIAGMPGAVAAFLAFFLPTSIIAIVVCTVWGRVRSVPWLAAGRVALLPVGVGLSIA